MENNFYKILVADDESDVLEIMAKKVACEGYQVIKASDGLEAWNKIQSELPDIILLDRSMPQMDGLTVLKQLRENPPSNKWIPVIIVSAHGELQDIQTGLSMEADHYITKPCKIEEILKGIKLMISLIPQRKLDADSDTKES